MYAYYGSDGYVTDVYETNALLSSEGTQTLDMADSGTQTLPLTNGHAANAYSSYQVRDSKHRG